MNSSFVARIATELEEIKASGLFKTERIIASPQGAEIMVNGRKVLNFCANNYLGLWSHPRVIEAAHKLVTSHLRLVAKIAVGYRGYGLPVGELIGEGNIGMVQAVKRFDPDRGFRLAT